ncbi:unnamed protein product [Arabidopsis halleri]
MINSSKKNLISTFSSIFTICIVMIYVTCYETFQQDGEPFSIRPLTTITVRNNNDYLLGIHCKSEDDDLGFHILKKGELYGWKFHVNLRNSTLFFSVDLAKDKIIKVCSTFAGPKAIFIDVEIVLGMQKKMVYMVIATCLKQLYGFSSG